MDSLHQQALARAVEVLGNEFFSLDITFHAMSEGKEGDVTSFWPGGEDEDIIVCVLNGKDMWEPFHRQDFFYQLRVEK